MTNGSFNAAFVEFDSSDFETQADKVFGIYQALDVIDEAFNQRAIPYNNACLDVALLSGLSEVRRSH